MTRMKTLTLLGGALVLGGVACEETPERPELRLVDLKGTTMRVSYIQASLPRNLGNGEGGRVEVSFHGASTSCFTLAPSVRAMVDGHEMERVADNGREESC